MRPQAEPIHKRLFKTIYPFTDAPTNPSSWSSFVRKCLEPETKAERERFYGPDDAVNTLEGRYPGFQYDYWPHRRRLQDWTHHGLLFTAMDELQLTPHEISQLCTWDGTLAHKQKYEKKHHVKIEDTTGLSAYHRMLCAQRSPLHDLCPECEIYNDATDTNVATETAYDPCGLSFTFGNLPDASNRPGESTPMPGHSSNEGGLQSAGAVLNEPLTAAAVAPENGNDSAVMDPEFEAWLKEVHEQGPTMTWAELFGRPLSLPDQIRWDTT